MKISTTFNSFSKLITVKKIEAGLAKTSLNDKFSSVIKEVCRHAKIIYNKGKDNY